MQDDVKICPKWTRNKLVDIYYIRRPVPEACEMIWLHEKKNNIAGTNPETMPINEKILKKIRDTRSGLRCHQCEFEKLEKKKSTKVKFKCLHESRFYSNNQ